MPDRGQIPAAFIAWDVRGRTFWREAVETACYGPECAKRTYPVITSRGFIPPEMHPIRTSRGFIPSRMEKEDTEDTLESSHLDYSEVFADGKGGKYIHPASILAYGKEAKAIRYRCMLN